MSHNILGQVVLIFIQSGAAYRSQGFEDDILGISPGRLGWYCGCLLPSQAHAIRRKIHNKILRPIGSPALQFVLHAFLFSNYPATPIVIIQFSAGHALSASPSDTKKEERKRKDQTKNIRSDLEHHIRSDQGARTRDGPDGRNDTRGCHDWRTLTEARKLLRLIEARDSSQLGLGLWEI